MSAAPIIANPIGWVQVRLLGGWRRILGVTGAYAGAVLLIHILIYRSMKWEGMPLAAFAGGALTVMIWISAVVLLFVGSGAIKKAVHRDFTSEMIGSHRITAMTGYTAVLGYVTGATLQASTLTLVNWLACTILALLAGTPVWAPTLVILVLACLAVMFWALAVLLALDSRGAYSIVWALVILMFLSNSRVLEFLPGLGLLLGFATVSTLPAAAAAGITEVSVFLSVFAQLALALTFFIAASRKFARDDVQAFNPRLAFAFLALCSLIAAVGLLLAITSAAPVVMLMGASLDLQCITTISVLGLLAFLPMASAASDATRRARYLAKDPDSSSRPPGSFLTAPVLATFIVFCILAAIPASAFHDIFPTGEVATVMQRGGWIAAFFFLSLVTVAGVLRFAYACCSKVLWIIILYLAVVWALPPFVDLSLEFIQNRPPGEPRSMFFAFSPVGAWIIAFGKMHGPLLPGLVFHAALAAGSMLLARRAKY